MCIGAGSFTLPSAQCIRFFAYIWLNYVTFGTMYSVFRIHLAYCVTFGTMYSVIRIHWLICVTFGTMYSVIRIHLARLRYLRHNVFGYSHTLAYYVTFGTMYSVIRIHLARLRLRHNVFGYSHILAYLRYLRHNVFGFSHTFGSFALPSAQCIRLFAYIWLICVSFGTMYSVIRIHWLITLPSAQCIRLFAYIWLKYVTFGTMYSVFRIHWLIALPSAQCIRFFAYIWLFTLPSAQCIRFFAYIWLMRYLRHNIFGFSHTFGLSMLPSAQCIRLFAYIWLVYVTFGTMYSVIRIHLAYLCYLRHNVFGYSHTFGSFTLPSAQCIRLFAYIWLVYVTFGTLYSVFHIHLARLRYLRHNVFGFSHTFVRKLD
jgi:hypothetical protein